MNARMRSFARDELPVRAGIVVVCGVEWLVQVADEVQKELQRHEVFGSTGGRIVELGRKLIYLVYHAGLWWTFRSPDPGRKWR